MSRKFQEPSYWDSENDDPMQVRDEYKWMRTLTNKRLDEQCEEYGSVQAQLLDSLPQYVVSHVDRIQHRLLWKRYMECKEELKLKHPEGKMFFFLSFFPPSVKASLASCNDYVLALR